MMIVAIPQYQDDIAPCFEAANHFLISSLENGREVSSKIVGCPECDGLAQIRLMRDSNVAVLICNGIKRIYRDMLQSAGIEVISNITYSVRQALELFRVGELKPLPDREMPSDFCPRISLNDLICWAKDLFESNGYKVRSGPGLSPFLIDLVADLSCPVCGKTVRIAICCGAHMYNPDQEIRQFHLITGANYDARVYIRPGTPELQQCCREYGVELIDPDAEPAGSGKSRADRIPLLKSTIPGHERASGIGE